jgi:hypothetical protein
MDGFVGFRFFGGLTKKVDFRRDIVCAWDEQQQHGKTTY